MSALPSLGAPAITLSRAIAAAAVTLPAMLRPVASSPHVRDRGSRTQRGHSVPAACLLPHPPRPAAFESIIDYRKFVVRIQQKDMERVPEILGAIPPEKVQTMQKALATVWRKCVGSPAAVAAPWSVPGTAARAAGRAHVLRDPC